MSTTAEPAKGKGNGKGIGKEAMADVAKQHELEKLGWKVVPHDAGFLALEKESERKVGPASSIAALHTQVMLAAGPKRTEQPAEEPEPGNGKVVKMGSTSLAAGQYEPRLPTMEEPEIDELNRLGDMAIDLKEAKEKANAAFKDGCDVMREKMREYERKRYARRGFVITIEDSEKLVIKKAEAAPAKNPSTKKLAAGK